MLTLSLMHCLAWVVPMDASVTNWLPTLILTPTGMVRLTKGTIYWNDGEGWVPIGSQNHKFGAAFDGWGYSISNLYINQGEDVPVGLFGSTGSNSNIKRVGLVSVSVSGNDTAGGLAGDHSGAITNSYTTGMCPLLESMQEAWLE